jgi:rubrerythrin
MNDISKQVMSVIKESIRLEINGRTFFQHAAEVTHNKHGKKMFQKLAQDEEGHLKAFGELFSAVIGNDEWKKCVDEEETKGTAALIENLKTKVEKEGKEESASELAAIRIGMDLERQAIDFFKKSGKETNDPKAHEIFNRIAGEERIHYDLLQAQYDSVTNSGFWFDIAEFRMDGKY